jgi:hypothetical protein
MSVELVHSADEATQKRVFRLMADTLFLSRLTPLQARAVYDEIEKARDALSRILDHADGKNA